MRAPLAALLLTFAASAQALPFQARLEGQVIDPLHEPVANALVVVEHDGLVVAATRSDGDGAFVFPRVPAQLVTVRATTDAPRIGALLVDLVGQGRGFAAVRMMPARKLSGTVRDDTGEPIAGAWVFASPNAGQPFALAHCTGRSDAQGKYELTHVAMGKCHVRAWTDKHDSAGFAAILDGRDDATLDCVVERDDAPWVTFRLENATEVQRGRAKLRVMGFHRRQHVPMPPDLMRPLATEPGEWQVNGWTHHDMLYAWVELDGATMWPGTHVVAAGAGTTTRRFLVGDDDGSIRGTLRHENGEPAAGIGLLAQPLGRVAGINSARRMTRTNERGEFMLQSPVSADKRFALRTLSPTSVLVGNDDNPVWYVAKHFSDQTWDLKVRPAHSVRVNVDGDTAPHGTLVTLSVVRKDGPSLVGTGIVGLDGTVHISCLHLDLPAELEITAHGPAGIGTLKTAARTGRDEHIGRVQLEPAASLLVLVVDQKGKPVPGAHISGRAYRGTASFRAAAGRDGRLRVRGLTPGTYYVNALGSTAWHREYVDVEAGEPTELTVTIIE